MRLRRAAFSPENRGDGLWAPGAPRGDVPGPPAEPGGADALQVPAAGGAGAALPNAGGAGCLCAGKWAKHTC